MTKPLKNIHTNLVAIDVIKKVDIFQTLSSNDLALEDLCKYLIYIKKPKGFPIIKEGDVGDRFFVLLKGQVGVYKKTPEGDEYKVVIVDDQSHQGLGDGGLVEAEKRSATVICECDCEFFVLTQESFQNFSEEHPEWALPIYKDLFKKQMKRMRKLTIDIMLLHKALTNEIRGN